MRRNDKRPPRVSVLMPVRNGERWLARAASSVLAQTETSLELIVIDDGSTDGTTATLERLGAADRRIRVVRQPPGGLVTALNLGLAEARAPLVARLDCDDLAHPDRLQRQADCLAGRPAVGLVGAWVVEIDMRGRQIGARTPPTDSPTLNRLLRRGNPFVHSSIMARTELLRDLGGYRAAFEGAEDYDLWLRVSEVAELSILPEVLVSYRVHGGGVSARRKLRQAFSVRLAQRAAQARRERLSDPAESLHEPPDWGCARSAGAFYARDAALYRWLEGEAAPPGELDAEPILEWIADLNHAERRLAAHSLLARMRSSDPAKSGSARLLLWRLCRERPSTVLRAAWSLRR